MAGPVLIRPCKAKEAASEAVTEAKISKRCSDFTASKLFLNFDLSELPQNSYGFPAGIAYI